MSEIVFRWSGLMLILGAVLFGIATIHAGTFPRAAGILLLAAMAGFFFNFFVAEFLPPVAGQFGTAIFGILLGFASAWIGASLWMTKLGPVL